ncbi:MAG: M20/M25/M40 family metallo-hydrolase [Caulobacter sp.]|nr:M20/M25/M40 family metallo-hydrolase [Caulobacter sp.]
MRRILLATLAASFVSGAALATPGDRALDDVRILSADDMAGRGIETEGGARARAYVTARFREMGLAAREQPFGFTRKRDGKEVHGINLIVRIEGSRPGGKVIVVTAHYDHLGTRDGVIFNGADDNASGVAGLLAVAEAFKAAPPKHTILIVALDGEENGLRGARAFVESPPVPLETIGLNVNFDMLGKNAKNELYAAGGSQFSWLKVRLEQVARGAPVTLLLGHDTDADGQQNNWTLQSDHGVFAKAGVPWVYFGVEDHPEYHKATDDFATVPQDFFLRSVKTVVAACRLFDDELDAMMQEARG